METLQTQFMNSLLSRLKPISFFAPSLYYLKPFSTINSLTPCSALSSSSRISKSNRSIINASTETAIVKTTAAETAKQLKVDWLESLSCPFPVNQTRLYTCSGNEGSNWVIGVDPDLSGAIALLKNDDSGSSAQVFDNPCLKVLIGKRMRKRLDAKSIVQLLRDIDAPIGTTAYIEQSVPFPQDGKQGWWSGGFCYGLWIGMLVASGFSVVPVPSVTWKKKFEITGSRFTKDDSRRVASTLFPSLSSSLTRKRDHGRAEALLIAAYGKEMKLNSETSCTSEELP